ncbi:alanine racemase [Ancylobacter dichloromethanicus]|uniref:Alanine racemase n=1 Tax=Ancylobacter dichloromethanicus TaxID=518825 RepID=A0A9W6JA15_9HYPH|nr:alanine racemase [Ancylobacter dichloromethanicus]MBS7552672.1 alanine racemase [Ancylobacter dichloromethanicus]GLK72035.1 alanine racemase [Ancylobacter dichloromethanicus]
MFGEISEAQRQAADAAPGVLTVDLAALAANYRLLCRQTGPARVAGVVKADAYGLGAARVAPALYAAGCRDFFIAQFGEALDLQPVLAADAQLYVLNGLQPGAEPRCAEAGIIPVLNSLEQLDNWSRLALARGVILPALLQFDTGMSRLGLSPEEVELLAESPVRLAGIKVLHVMSHLASADDPLSAQNAEQLVAMRRFAARFPGATPSFANSGGLFLDADYHGALVRPGIALYGGAPNLARPNPMQPVVRLDLRVIQTRTVPAGTRIGYGGTHVTRSERRLATLAAGYADGLPRSLSDRGAAYAGATRLPIVGRVSMDSLTVDVTALPPGALRLGSLVEMIGPHQTLDALASDAGTLSYEILTGLGARFHRLAR